MKSYLPRDPGEQRKWLLVNADGKPVGRLAVNIANALRGKNRPTYSPQVDTGDFVVVVNAEKVVLTGKKDEQKIYRRYSGFRDGLKEVKASVMRARHPDRIIRLAVKGMLPRNHLCRGMMRRLKIYAGAEHPHTAQNPVKTEWL